MERQQTHSKKMGRKLEEYENILPKLIEVEQLQESLLRENNSLKSVLRMQQALLGNVAIMASKATPQPNALLEQIRLLTHAFVDRHPIKE